MYVNADIIKDNDIYNGVALPVDLNDIIMSALHCRRGCMWKESPQRYMDSLFINAVSTKESLESMTYRQRDFYTFLYNDYGRERVIRSLHIDDRVVQRYICDSVLIPALEKQLIYDNGACVKGKGVDFTRKRLESKLVKFFKKYGINGYIMKIDFSKYFDNIPHSELKESLAKIPELEIWLDILFSMIDQFALEVPEYFNESTPIDSLKIKGMVKKCNTLGVPLKTIHRSLGIGSQVSQILGVWYPTPIDVLCTTVLGFKYYGRYMDDIYILHPDKNVLKSALGKIIDKAKEIGIFVNMKKTKIMKLSNGFTFMKTHYTFVNGRLRKRISKKTFIRMRRKLKAFKIKLDSGTMSFKDINQAYESWRGHNVRYGCWSQITQTDRLYASLYSEYIINSKNGTLSPVFYLTQLIAAMDVQPYHLPVPRCQALPAMR